MVLLISSELLQVNIDLKDSVTVHALFLFLFFAVLQIRIQGLVHTRQALYALSYISSSHALLFLKIIFYYGHTSEILWVQLQTSEVK